MKYAVWLQIMTCTMDASYRLRQQRPHCRACLDRTSKGFGKKWHWRWSEEEEDITKWTDMGEAFNVEETEISCWEEWAWFNGDSGGQRVKYHQHYYVFKNKRTWLICQTSKLPWTKIHSYPLKVCVSGVMPRWQESCRCGDKHFITW